MTLPATISAGSYQPDIDCSNGVTASAALTVKAVPGVAPATGDGTTATATDDRLTAAGLGLASLGAVSGVLLLTRRRFRPRPRA